MKSWWSNNGEQKKKALSLFWSVKQPSICDRIGHRRKKR